MGAQNSDLRKKKVKYTLYYSRTDFGWISQKCAQKE